MSSRTWHFLPTLWFVLASEHLTDIASSLSSFFILFLFKIRRKCQFPREFHSYTRRMKKYHRPLSMIGPIFLYRYRSASFRQIWFFVKIRNHRWKNLILFFFSTTLILINLYKIKQETCFNSCRQSSVTSLSCTCVTVIKTVLQRCSVLVRLAGFREVLERPWMTYSLCTELGNCLLLRVFQTPLLCSIFFFWIQH